MASIKQRIKAIRGEGMNALSFLAVVWTLWEDESSLLSVFFVLMGIVILAIDCYFIHCQWMLKKNHGIPCLGRLNTGAMDDLLSDLPQVIWVLGYVWIFKFSLISMICGFNSALAIIEDLVGIQEEKINSRPPSDDEEMQRLN